MSARAEWQPLDLSASELTYAVTSSVLEEFAQGHSIGDVLRELVQNEYDARGRSLSVTFGAEGLEVHGTGRVIDRAGWRRLSVMLGTGRVVGDDRDVPQKVNGIGSKNHGLRAMFLIGDRIYVRSGGRQTLLDLYRGAPPAPRPDPTSVGLAGAHIFVPYRSASEGQLEPYESSRRMRDVELLATELAPTLVKLADPSAPRSLRSVTVASSETGRLLNWRQTVKLVRRHRVGGDILSRTIELRDQAPGRPNRRTRIQELEYRKSFPVPSSHGFHVFPDYFRVPGGRVHIGLSFRLKRKRPDLDHQGSFYYPLGFTHDSTGCAISVSAPFRMNGDRSALVDPTTSYWNEWLLSTAAEFALELLTGEWFDSFGQSAYLALEDTDRAAVPQFGESIWTGLSERECWPTRARASRARKPTFAAADDIRIGASAELDALPGDTWRLHERLDHPGVRAMARRAGAPEFTVASAIRLRCAGEDASHLATRYDHETALYYPGFPDALADLNLQKLYARTFDAHRLQLTEDNRSDLSDAPTTLTAAETLAAPSEPLWVVDDALAAAAPVNAAQRLHPALAGFRTLTKLCKPFDISEWALEVASRAADGTVDEDDRETLYRYLSRRPEAIRRNAWAALRRSPVFRDHRNDWVAVTAMLQRRAAGASRLEAALHFPSKDIGRNSRLARKLRIRSKITGTDLIQYARLVAADSQLADEFEETLNQLRGLLTRPTVARLRSIRFLRSTQGGLVAPERAYVRTAYLLSCVGDDATFAAGPHTTLHGRLGSRTTPDAGDITSYLDSLRASANTGPPHPEILYSALVEALQREYGDASWHSDEAILFDGGTWHAPEDVLLGKKHRAIFAAAVPVVVAGALEHTYEELGANREPTSEHWMRFFQWIDRRGEAGTRRLSAKELAALRQTYVKLGSLPSSVPDSSRVFADSAGRLHTRAEVRALAFLINDDPRTAAAVADAAVPIAFGDNEASARHFYRASGVKLLTEARKPILVDVGEVRSSPRWFDEAAEITRLQQPVFASAVHALAVANGSRTTGSERELRRRLRNITRVTFVSTLDEIWKIGGHEVRVPGEVAVDGSRIALQKIKSRSELHGLLALAVASMAEATPALQPALADAVYRVLNCESSAELAHYLEQRGIPWRASWQIDPGDAEDAEEDVDGRAMLAETLKEQLLLKPRGTPPAPMRPTGSGNGSQPEKPEQPTPPLPPLSGVQLQELPSSTWNPVERDARGGGGGGGWRPRSPAEQEEDRELARRAEQLVHRAEVERVGGLGYPATRVVWTSQAAPAADHDILSVADDGGDLWVEVKATKSQHGRFDWPRAEFELALRARERYVLCRVYEAHTATPSMTRHHDPIGKLERGEMRLDISNLAAEVAPLPGERATIATPAPARESS